MPRNVFDVDRHPRTSRAPRPVRPSLALTIGVAAEAVESALEFDHGHATMPGTTEGKNLGNELRRVVGRFDDRLAGLAELPSGRLTG